jgi:Ca2+-binding EF-hand superfamily protein
MKKPGVPKQAFNPKLYERPGLSEDEIVEIKEAFDLFDPDRTGFVSPRDLREAMSALGYELKNQTIFQMIANLEKDEVTQVDFQEFLNLMTARINEKESKEDIRKVFRLFDEENTGYITAQNLKKIAKDLGETMEDIEIREMIERADTDGDGRITFEDFYSIMTKKVFM